MRICYVSHIGSHFSVPYIEYFADQGHEVHLISLQAGDHPQAIMHHPLRRSVDPMKAGPVYLWAWRAVRRVIREIRPDIVHAHYLTSNGFMAARCGFHPLVVSGRGSDVTQSLGHPIKRRLIAYAMRKADLVNVVSGELEETVLGMGVPGGKVLRLTQGIPTGPFMATRNSRRPGPPRLICTRKLLPLYQCDRIIRALATLASRGEVFELVFAAGGPLEAELQAQVEQAGLADRVRFLGGFAQDELPGLLAETDIYVSASRWDGTSPALLEAMASGAFPVVSDIPANREWLSGDGDCLYFNPSDDRQLVAALTTAMRDEALRQAAVDRNRRVVAERGDRESNMRILAGHYERLVGGARSVASL